MSLKRTLVGLFRSHDGTSDRAKDPALKTRYYNLSRDKAWDEVSSTLKKVPGFKVLHEVQSVGEITLEKRTGFGRTLDITVSVLNTSPVRCAVDIYSASRGSLGDLGANYRVIQRLYQTLEKKLGKYKVD
ncbi:MULTISPECIES: DUF1499 domain-containing protein [Paenibacillus]|uniref:DUF1499 domain-containing protein n=1 Tax=Paenibacillus helianthi TaxID=1349432 RepID=A0ABX3EJI0_9BACL|nr:MULTISPECIES: DUF1499 domain-containing protein [Paenibacillus]OKP80688.1 hypothetical protein A3844_26755 [Paenibacillus helianthi]OKP85028.1 hypothetical protein A3842_07770 [Paenibacillus sp. P3E]OKP89098.1 hypothetical protein A3848_16465 [Paenibacillus sp. P32E]